MRYKRFRTAATMFILSLVIIIAAIVFVGSQAAQTTQTDDTAQRVLIEKNRITGSTVPEVISVPRSPAPGDETSTTLPLRFDSAIRRFERGKLRDTAFSAEVQVESVWPLREGGTTMRKTTYLIYRDGQGRTRRDLTSDQTNAAATADSRPRSSVINDPAASSTYILDHRSNTVRKISRAADDDTEPQPNVTQLTRGTAPGFINVGTPGSQVAKTDLPRERRASEFKEQLGQREIGGVMAEGTRYVRAISIGASSNEKPIEITTEEWYSVELQAIVAITISDPRFGRSEYRFVNIVRGEPSPTLFVIPQNYKLRN